MRYDASRDMAWEACTKEKVDKLIEFDHSFIDPLPQKGLTEIAKGPLALHRAPAIMVVAFPVCKALRVIRISVSPNSDSDMADCP